MSLLNNNYQTVHFITYNRHHHYQLKANLPNNKSPNKTINEQLNTRICNNFIPWNHTKHRNNLLISLHYTCLYFFLFFPFKVNQWISCSNLEQFYSVQFLLELYEYEKSEEPPISHHRVFAASMLLLVEALLSLDKAILIPVVFVFFDEVVVDLCCCLSSLWNRPHHQGLTAATITGCKHPFDICWEVAITSLEVWPVVSVHTQLLGNCLAEWNKASSDGRRLLQSLSVARTYLCF